MSSQKIELDTYQKVLKAVENSTSELFFNELFANLDKYLIEVGDSSTQPLYCLTPYLTECRCDRFDRLKNNRRKDYEDEIIQFTLQNLHPKQDDVLNYLSLGSGGLLQDFFLLYRLIKEVGIKNLNIVIIERNLFPEQVEQLKAMLSAISHDIKINITYHKELSIYQTINKNQTLFDIVNVSDFDEFAEYIDIVMDAKKLLNEKGRMFVSTSKYNYQFDSQKCVHVKSSELSDNINNLKKDILNIHRFSKNKDTFYCAISFAKITALIDAIIPAALELGYEKFLLTIPNNDQKQQSGIEQFLKALFPETKFIFNWIEEIQNTDNKYGRTPIRPVAIKNKTQKLPYHVIYWSTIQHSSLNAWVAKEIGKFSKEEYYAETMLIVEKPINDGDGHWRFHAKHGYQIYLSPDEKFEKKLKKMFESLFSKLDLSQLFISNLGDLFREEKNTNNSKCETVIDSCLNP